MSNGSNPPPSTAEADALVGEAWTAHYHGQNDDAIRKFEDVLQRWPDHIDGNYGLALTLRTVGQKEKSVERFRKTKALLDAALAAEPDEVNARYVMLSRFCDQNIAML